MPPPCDSTVPQATFGRWESAFTRLETRAHYPLLAHLSRLRVAVRGCAITLGEQPRPELPLTAASRVPGQQGMKSVAAARKPTMALQVDYCHYRTHSALWYLAPIEFTARCTASDPKSILATPQATSPHQRSRGSTQPALSSHTLKDFWAI